MTPDYRALYLSLIRDALVALRWHDERDEQEALRQEKP